MSDIFWVILGGLGMLVGSATTILLFVAVLRWFFRRPPTWEESAEELAAMPVEEIAAVEDIEEGRGDGPPPGVRVPELGERTRRLLATNDLFYADLLTGVLRDAGIWCFAHGNADAVGATGVPATSLYVAEKDLQLARQLVDEVESEARQRRMKREQMFACPGCGYDLRATPERCPECGLAL